MNQPPPNPDSQQPSASPPSQQQAEDYTMGGETRSVQGDNNRVIQGDENAVIQGDGNWVLIVKQFLLGQQTVAPVGNPARPKNQRELLADVKDEVIARLNSSLHNAVLINLGKHMQPEQVRRSWDAEIKIGLKPSALLPPTTSIIEVFDQKDIAGKLLILGAPGSGKTTTQLELAQDLVSRAEAEPSYPIPILFNLSSWEDHRQPITEWMVTELNSKYGIRAKLGKKWVESRQLLPLLDGLDELKPILQKSCIEAINQLLKGKCRPKYLVVCSRVEEYDIHKTPFQLNAAICLQPLTNQQIQSYLITINYTELWHQTISRDSNLLELVQTPLLLSVTILSYEEISIEKWQELSSNEDRLQYLLDAYLRRMLGRQVDTPVYVQQQPSSRQTLHWLIWLAKMLQRESQVTEFLIEKIQPSCLRTRLQKYVYDLGVTLGVTLIVALIVLLIARPPFGLIVANLFFVPIVVLIIALIVRPRQYYIKTVEYLGWSWTKVKKWLFSGLRIGTCVLSPVLIPVVLACLFTGNISYLLTFIYFIILSTYNWLIFGLILIFELILIFGLTSLDIKTKIVPNQAIWKSAANAKNAGLIVGQFFGLIAWLISSLFKQSDQLYFGLIGLLVGITIGGLIYGGTACIQHFTLRLILYLNRYIPWNYACFLDYATERLFLQRVGGRYRFIHKLLQDHFAKMPLDTFKLRD